MRLARFQGGVVTGGDFFPYIRALNAPLALMKWVGLHSFVLARRS